MPISSYIVQIDKNKTEEIVDSINLLNGASVSNVEDSGLVVITDTEDKEQDKSLWGEMESVEGVLKVNLIYYNFEDEEEDHADR